MGLTRCGALENGEFYISFSVIGLDGSLSLSLEEEERIVDMMTVTEDGTYSFSESIENDFVINISSQPSGQVCSIVNGSGYSIFSSSRADIYCSAESATVNVEVTGLVDGSNFILDLNGVEELTLANGSNTFETLLANDTPYVVSVEDLPSDRRCETLDDTRGTSSGEDITITYECSLSNFFFVGGSEAADFGGRVEADEICSTRAEQYSNLGWMSCSGDIMAFLSVSEDDEIRDIPTNYDVNTDLPIYLLHPSVQTRIGDNWNDLLDGSIANNMVSSFWSSSNNDGSLDGDACQGWTEVSQDSVNVGGFDYEDNWIAGAGNCINESRDILCFCSQSDEDSSDDSVDGETYTLGGIIEGLSGTITLSLNENEQTLDIEENGSFTFGTNLNSETEYTVSISNSPEGQTCDISNETGTISSNVNNISIQCELNRSYFFLSENSVASDFGGRDGADDICEASYEELDLEVFCLGGIRAFITVDGDDEIAGMAESFDIDESHPLYNAQTDLIIANDWVDLLDGSIQNPITENWWSGSLDNGTDSLETCNGWTETSDDGVLHGTANETDAEWIFNGILDCNDNLHILCICYQ